MIELNWIETAAQLPPEGDIVFVSGGLGFLYGDVWYSASENPPRLIRWPVTHWAPIHVPVLETK